ncbi:DUF4197 domain-containing protein [Sphingobium indicum]|uniref:DUF4197 domain-containing protein n=1 Tax=Sphingobium indicum TaxID=332055 RepID=UPI000A0641A6|nr:DUF4197 domain-containing protein [Sphingobium indicum]
MRTSGSTTSRRAVVLGLAAAGCLPLSARASIPGSLGLKELLGSASDRALDTLAQPGAFYNDPAVRIGLPLLGGAGRSGGALGTLLGAGDQLGLTDGLTRKLNDAAGIAAREAKPLFRSAITGLTLADVPGIATQSDGATQYLRRTAGATLSTRLRPLIDAALGEVGAFASLEGLARRSKLVGAAGITRRHLGQSVTDQAVNGIFRYVGQEEGRLRADPGKAAGSLLKGLIGN